VATDLELLTEARTAVLTAIRDNAGKPSYSIDGQSVSRTEIFRQLAELNDQIQAVGGPVEEITEGYV
jgi:archaellum component FlaC